MKILVADDSMVMRRLLVSFLQDWDYEVLEAEDGEQAWTLFQRENISLVLTDWIMPDVDGLELIRRIRATDRGHFTYLILLTAKSEKEDLVTAMEAGADDFLAKPCDREELRVRLREGERIIRLQDELAEQNRQLKETQAALMQSEKLASLGQLAAGMAHEINNPIAFVSNNLAVLHRDLESLVKLLDKYQQTQAYLQTAPQNLLDDLHSLEKECDLDWLRQNLPQLLRSSTQGLIRVRDIISNLRDFARLDRATYDSLDLPKAVQATLELLRHIYDEKSLVFDIDMQPSLPIICHPDKIHQVLYNTLLNAIQASDPNSHIEISLCTVSRSNEPSSTEPSSTVSSSTVSSSNEAEWVSLAIKDHGIGMDAATLERVFEPFFTTKPVGAGTGLGMAVSYGIVRDHNGAIAIESQPTKGTTVRIQLPMKPRIIVDNASHTISSGTQNANH